MKFFSLFNNIPYDISGDQEYKIVSNIFNKVILDKKIKEDEDVYLIYDMIDGDTAEIISDKLYDTPDLHWTILLLNDIVNPYYDFPLSQNSFENYLNKKYDYASLFLDNISGTFTEGESITYGGNTVTVVSYNPTFKRLCVSGLDEEITTSISGASGSADVVRCDVDSIYSLHHIENSNGDIINVIPNPNNESDIDYIDNYINGVSVPEDLTWMYIYNYDYELSINESKRTIKLIKPKYINGVKKLFESRMKAI